MAIYMYIAYMTFQTISFYTTIDKLYTPVWNRANHYDYNHNFFISLKTFWSLAGSVARAGIYNF